MNKCIYMGRLTRDPEVHTYQNSNGGGQITRFSIAVDRRFKREGEPDADFIECTSFGKTAEFVSKYFSKGKRILVEGEMQNNNYEDKNGVKHYAMRCVVNNVEFCESKNSSGGGGSYQGQSQAPAPEVDEDGFMKVDASMEEELPFA